MPTCPFRQAAKIIRDEEHEVVAGRAQFVMTLSDRVLLREHSPPADQIEQNS